MNKKSIDILKRISIIGTILLTALILLASDISIAGAFDGSPTINDLTALTQTSFDWYGFDAASIIGKSVKSGTSADYNRVGGYCVDPHTKMKSGMDYQVVNVIDVGSTVKIYGKNGMYEYSLDDSRVRPALILGYLAKGAYQNGETKAAKGTYKIALPAVFLNKQFNQEFKEIGLDPSIGYSTNSPNAYYVWGKSNPTSYEKLVEAMNWAASAKSSGGSITVNPKAESDYSIIIKDNKTYLGPYNVSLTGGSKIQTIRVNGNQEAYGVAEEVGGKITTPKTDSNGKYYTLEDENGTEKSLNNRDFYIVLDGKVTEVNSIKLIGQTMKVASSIRARIVIVGKGASQNFIIYEGEDSDMTPETELPKPTLRYGELLIKKYDQFKNIDNLAGIEFKVYYKNQGKWVKVINDTETDYVSFEEATSFVTDKEGNVPLIKNLLQGYYQIYETKIPNGENGTADLTKYYAELPEIDVPNGNTTIKAKAKLVLGENDNPDINITSGATIELGIVNFRDLVELSIYKIDKKTTLPLKGIEFKLYKKDSGWVKFDKEKNNEVTTVKASVNEADVLTTAENGKTQVLSKLPGGVYEIYEVGLGEYGNIYEELKEQTVNGETFMGLSKGEINVIEAMEETQGKEISVTVENDQKYIDISGKVWEDVPTGKGQQSINNLLGEEDYRIDGIKVKLIDSTDGKVVKETTTGEANGEHGVYKFQKVEIEKLKDYYVEFTYDGVTYKNVLKSYEPDEVTSKADEDEKQRNSLNEAFKEITGEGQVVKYNDKEIKLTYSKVENNADSKAEPVVTLNNLCDRSSDKNKETVKDNYLTITKQGDFLLNSQTENAYLNNKYNEIKKAKQNTIVTEIPNVNFGVYQREMPDVSVSKDLAKATVTIKGESFDYIYRSKDGSIETTDGVAFERKYVLDENDRFYAPVYKADAKYENKEDESKNLKVYVTYKIGLVNNSDNLDIKVNALNERYSKQFKFYEMYKLDESGNKEVILNKVNEVEDGDYKFFRVKDLDILVNHGHIEKAENGEEKLVSGLEYVYVVLEIPRKEVLRENGEIDTKKIYRTYTELSSYSIEQDGKLYAGYDTDSIPNNAKFPQISEDDEAYAKALQIQSRERKTYGMVFEDSAKEDLLQNSSERLGNGMYDEGEKHIKNVRVQLLDMENGGAVVAEAKTDDNGIYSFEGFTPGKYKVRFIWGEGENTTIVDGNAVTVDSYKSTIWTEDQNNSETWFDEPTSKYSDALDDWSTREQLDKQNNGLAGLLNDKNVADGQKAKMISDTKQIGIGIEKEANKELESVEKFEEDKTVEVYFINNVDFGIIERPRQTIKIEKVVSHLNITTEDGQTIAEAMLDGDEMKVIGGVGSVTGGPKLGYIKCEMDKQLISSNTSAEVGYKITVTNTSEKDFEGKAYYYFGNSEGATPVKIKADGVYDYVNGIKIETDKWKSVNKESKKTVTSELAEKIKNPSKMTSMYKETVNGVTKYVEETVGENIKKTIDEFFKTDETISISNIESAISHDFQVSKLEDDVVLEAGQHKDYEYKASTVLTAMGDIRFDNTVEIADVTRVSTTGRHVSVLGSNFYDSAEYITVTQPTGENRDYTPGVMIAVSVMAILGIGIIVIKKVVLK